MKAKSESEREVRRVGAGHLDDEVAMEKGPPLSHWRGHATSCGYGSHHYIRLSGIVV